MFKDRIFLAQKQFIMIYREISRPENGLVTQRAHESAPVLKGGILGWRQGQLQKKK